MNVWKPIALCSTTAFVALIGIQVASAASNSGSQPTLTGPCYDQPHMAAAKGFIEQALGELDKAEHNKGGWRERAIAAEKKAHEEINAGCAFANAH
jgi:hypothetical protein